MDSIVREETRYLILTALAEAPGYSAPDVLLEQFLAQYGIARPRDFVRGEMRHLEMLGAVKVAVFGSTLIATLTARGRDHVAHRIVLDGVKRPPPPEA